MGKLKYLLDYRKRWKHQKNRCKNLKKRINKLEKGIYEDLGFNEKDEIIRKQEKNITRKSNKIKKLQLEAQKYFDTMIENQMKIDKAIDLTERLIQEYKLNYGEELSKMLMAYNSLLEILGDKNE